ncbi:hypothetical protein [Moorena sp. SIO4A5]|uniref:hypothetical protein n=1 Tax=Moorena sp. SIO4A5 TaxID=2607838 RepID=UPI0013CCF763|nr:hypothetical protein [Moorena sp. SIO4A5]NEO24881.1 hypothetical protein [Moorena sp. SIO4A5]
MTDERFDRIEQRLTLLEQKLKTIELDVEPEGRISEGFEIISSDIDSLKEEMRRRISRLEHGQNRIEATLDVIVKQLTGWDKSD